MTRGIKVVSIQTEASQPALWSSLCLPMEATHNNPAQYAHYQDKMTKDQVIKLPRNPI